MNSANKYQSVSAQVHKSTRIFLTCALVTYAFVLFSGVSAFGDELTIDELDPTFILDDESGSNEKEASGLDIQLPAQASPVNLTSLLYKTLRAANFVSDANEESLKTVSFPETYTEQLAEQLKETRLSPPQPLTTRSIHQNPPDVKKVARLNPPQQDDLREIIEQIRSISTERPAATEKIEQKPREGVQKTKDIAQKTNNGEREVVETDTNIASSFVDVNKVEMRDYNDRILQQVDELIKEPNRISNPFELAEILFKTGRTAQAAVCYKRALATMTANDPNMAGERAWILFQIGNCLKYDDPNAARESYAELVRTHPDSPWAEAAKSRYDLVDWYQKENPRNLIVELKH